jgi:hypothetical protein
MDKGVNPQRDAASYAPQYGMCGVGGHWSAMQDGQGGCLLWLLGWQARVPGRDVEWACWTTMWVQPVGGVLHEVDEVM